MNRGRTEDEENKERLEDELRMGREGENAQYLFLVISLSEEGNEAD